MSIAVEESPSYAPARLLRWQALTMALMVVGYSGYYLCRSNLSVVIPLMTDELVAAGMDPGAAKVRLGWIASLGAITYAIGKLMGGALADFLGGRRNFLIGMAGAVLFTLVFAAGGALPMYSAAWLGGAFPVFTIAWMGNRIAQSLGWGGMMKITSRWFDYRTTGTVVGILSLSYLFGDAASRAFMGYLIANGVGWRGVFLAGAGVLAVILAVCTWLLKESPRDLDLPEGETNPLNVFGAKGNDARPADLGSLLGPLFRSRSFWYVCLLSLITTLLRETFNNWSPTYFKDVVKLPNEEAAWYSALFPFVGGISVILAGLAGDRLGRTGRATLLLIGLFLTGTVLWQLGRLPVDANPVWPLSLVTLVGFLLIGPYSYLGGAIALDFGGKRGGATAGGLIDGVGYIAGILAGGAVAQLATSRGWAGTFEALAIAAWASCAVAALYFIDQYRRPAGSVEFFDEETDAADPESAAGQAGHSREDD